MINKNIHPCFNAKVKGQFGRVHLPVAPKCNILCNYCNRKYDCVNESRPGVTSAVLAPTQAIAYLEQVLEAEPRITVAGIAGPGDPFANPQETMETLRLIRQRFPELLLCLASNGLGIAPYLDELAELQVSHVTITVNTVDPEIGAKIYSWVRDGKKIYRGLEAAQVLLARQLEAISGLKARGIVVKINTIVIPGVNDQHVEAVARKMRELGVDLLNCMPVYPNVDTPFGEIPEPEPAAMLAIQAAAESFCRRCAIAPAAGRMPWACWRPTGPRSCAAASPPAPRCRPPGRNPALCGGGLHGGSPGQFASRGGRFFPDLGTRGTGLPAAGRTSGPAAGRRRLPLVGPRGNPKRLPGGAGQCPGRDPRKPS